jgi:hypothetical protein
LRHVMNAVNDTILRENLQSLLMWLIIQLKQTKAKQDKTKQNSLLLYTKHCAYLINPALY